MKSISLQVGQFEVKHIKFTLTNHVFFNTKDYQSFGLPEYVLIDKFVYTAHALDVVEEGKINLSKVQRTDLNLGIDEKVVIQKFDPNQTQRCTSYIKVEIGFFARPTQVSIEANTIRDILKKDFNKQIITRNQSLTLSLKNCNFLLRFAEINLIGPKGEIIENADRGIIHEKIQTIDVCKIGNDGGLLTIEGGMTQGTLFTKNFNPEGMGVGGLDKEFTDILRRAFMSRMFPPETIKKLGIKHVRGILLYGPPGCGKTLMARQIGKMVSSVEPKIVDGPSILNKYVGESEANIRNLFAEAEEEQKAKGDDSQLHIIVLDELDAICKQRGSRGDSTGIMDTVVNQLLAKIDGVNALNNILVIGMTNRMDMLDDALLRPGRLEVQIEIGLPDEHGRVQILNIHTKKMRDNKMVGDDVSIEELAKRTKNFSGAEIEGLVLSATSFALKENFDMEKYKPKTDKFIIKKEHFDMALSEMKPAFGMDNNDVFPVLPDPFLVYSSAQEHVRDLLKESVQQLSTSNVTNKIAVMIGGRHGSGKTALAVEAAKQSGFPYIKMLSSEMLVGYSDQMKCSKIARVFTDAYRSAQSVIIIDDLERVLEYTAFGPRFDNTMLHLLLSYIRKPVPPNKRLYIIATTCLAPEILRTLDIWEAFTQHLHLPVVTGFDQFKTIAKESGMDKYIDEMGWADIGLQFQQKCIAIQNALLMLESFKEMKYTPTDFTNQMLAYCTEEADPWEEISILQS
ncbi:vesicle-fusing ATPase, putative [Entamoeba invadens IP1]|uniref:vesicle-fusing ATPase, putative n=1 Tax=Entamoeba invadens IP1 TaxID=370355 RepID=UPI0002C3F1F9|nr:vesicle-fusing ATPase, putative [Entamoeba invadens IP1]ELP93826.1 vesicle-fusing ATPase, putative [Entamoeba invadens IP1]|eukprot:XP_004260597.1 vesicle-fusing ATPase, putative [Entamoeba invadens IP1]